MARAASRRARSSGPRAATASAASLDSGGGVRLAAEAVTAAETDASAAEGDAPAWLCDVEQAAIPAAASTRHDAVRRRTVIARRLVTGRRWFIADWRPAAGQRLVTGRRFD